jgi:hypothetical protein
LEGNVNEKPLDKIMASLTNMDKSSVKNVKATPKNAATKTIASQRKRHPRSLRLKTKKIQR